MKICEEDEANQDVLGIVAACNCLSVDYIFLASPPSEAGTLDGVLPGEKTAEYIEKAIAYSERHLRLAPDDGGKFVALTNLGKHLHFALFIILLLKFSFDYRLMLRNEERTLSVRKISSRRSSNCY